MYNAFDLIDKVISRQEKGIFTVQFKDHEVKYCKGMIGLFYLHKKIMNIYGWRSYLDITDKNNIIIKPRYGFEGVILEISNRELNIKISAIPKNKLINYHSINEY